MPPARDRVGVVMASPLLALGLISILEEALPVEAMRLNLSEVTASRALQAVVLDARCVVNDLCSTVARLRKKLPLLKIVALGWPLPADEIQKIIGAGAKGYLLDSAGEAEIRMAIEVVLDGSIWAPRKVLAKLIDKGTSLVVNATPDASSEELSAREMEVMNLLLSGRSNREIGAAMGIEQTTVKAHLGRMLRKTRSKNRLEMTLRLAGQRHSTSSEADA